MNTFRFIVYVITAGFGWAVVSYAGYANLRGWPIGAWFARDFSWLQGFAYLAIAGSVVASIYSGAWWHAIAVLALANIFVRMLFPLLGPKSQWLSSVGVVVGLPLSVFLVWR